MARGEAVGGNRQPIIMGLIVLIGGLIVIAAAPRWAPAQTRFFMDVEKHFPLLIGILSSTIVFRTARAISDPRPALIQMNIRHAILTIIPLSASIALISAGPKYGLVVFALVIPAMFLGRFLRIT